MEEKDIVDRINDLCKENGITVKALERELGFANSTVYKWRNSKKKPPLEKVMAVAKRLHTTADYLYTGEEEQGSGFSPKMIELIEYASKLSPAALDYLVNSARDLNFLTKK